MRRRQALPILCQHSPLVLTQPNRNPTHKWISLFHSPRGPTARSSTQRITSLHGTRTKRVSVNVRVPTRWETWCNQFASVDT
ncbi:hypothetical protein PISMIDRAFT_680210 [Pisolithus microcarpus 441]|uniref:Uncharacterized protein n=1 Tax=Pisolithus microcarpus 441 TaxID=765257 RepID=A0A0C9Z0M1_9AGAM|nr:hypothetical protein PISMIDRAFT_680210 [Pisolithus microcarpus 441]